MQSERLVLKWGKERKCRGEYSKGGVAGCSGGFKRVFCWVLALNVLVYTALT